MALLLLTLVCDLALSWRSDTLCVYVGGVFFFFFKGGGVWDELDESKHLDFRVLV